MTEWRGDVPGGWIHLVRPTLVVNRGTSREEVLSLAEARERKFVVDDPVMQSMIDGARPDPEVHEALRRAHDAAECGDYYCGCWDGPFNDVTYNADTERETVVRASFSHTLKFLASLEEQGWALVKVEP